MKDPDMVLVRNDQGDYHPVEFQQDNIDPHQVVAEFGQNEIKRLNPKLQHDLAKFAATWMKNLRDQQGL